MMSRWEPLALFASSLALVACSQSQAATARPPEDAITVQTLAVGEAPMPVSLKTTGTLKGMLQTDLAANATGRVAETFVERGTEVSPGDLLAKLDIRSASLSAAEARANAALAAAQAETAKRECERYQRLFDQGAISAAELDRTRDTCRTSSISIRAAEARAQATALVVGDGTIRAPFRGVVVERHVQAGQFVRQEQKVVSLVSIEELKIELTVPEASLVAVKPGGLVTFTVPAYPDRVFQGTIRFIGGAVRETTRDIVAEAVVDNADRALRPGMFATVSLLTGEAPRAVVPKAAIVPREGLSHVFVVVNQRVEERVVQTGVERDGMVAVVRGLKVGERVVDKPSDAVKNGLKVN